MPDLNTARVGNVTMFVGGEIVTFGGHTSGFVPAATAEYFRDGHWHEIPMIYPHDEGFVAGLDDGRVMLGGGCAEAFGIGQTWGVEIYDPLLHSFTGMAVMSRKRTQANALALGDGSVVVSGNWYADDDIEVYRPGGVFRPVSRVSTFRHRPVITESGPGNALVFGGKDNRDQRVTEDGWVDRLQGEPFREPLLQEWVAEPLAPGNHAIGEYASLFAARRASDGRFALLKVSGEQFSLLETDFPFPEKSPEGQAIVWFGNVMVDRPSRCAFVPGTDSSGNCYLARVSYDATFEGGKAEMTVFRASAPAEGFPSNKMALLPGGRFVMPGGGTRITEDGAVVADNFAARREVYLFSVIPEEKKSPWLALLLPAAAFLLVGGGLLLMRHRLLRRQREDSTSAGDAFAVSQTTGTDLMSRLVALMEEEQLFRKKDLKKADMAARLGTNLTYVTATVNSQTGGSFTDFVTGYRIRYAQKLMREQPRMLLSEVAEMSGFASEQSFFRSFKARTGQTPSEWKASLK
ncbi:MAG: helix-turn-helix transcriptional regulator [Bacteroidales bacterium]|nr:helix-turn-helix transcriptional regulator [Bacteroidales bacterium]